MVSPMCHRVVAVIVAVMIVVYEADEPRSLASAAALSGGDGSPVHLPSHANINDNGEARHTNGNSSPRAGRQRRQFAVPNRAYGGDAQHTSGGISYNGQSQEYHHTEANRGGSGGFIWTSAAPPARDGGFNGGGADSHSYVTPQRGGSGGYINNHGGAGGAVTYPADTHREATTRIPGARGIYNRANRYNAAHGGEISAAGSVHGEVANSHAAAVPLSSTSDHSFRATYRLRGANRRSGISASRSISGRVRTF